MRKLTSIILACIFALSITASFAQEEDTSAQVTDTTAVADTTGADTDTAATDTALAEEEPEEPMEEETAEAETEEVPEETKTFHEFVKEKFIEGGADFMTPVLLVLILGLAISIERIIVLSLNSQNTTKFINEVEDELNKGGIEAAEKKVLGTSGPVASIFAQGLKRRNEGIEMVEKSIVSYGSVEMAKLERGLTWLSLFISLAPMLGFLGTVIGMIQAFDDIQAAGDIDPTVVAGGIKVALITTVAGLIVAIILQVFYNYLVNKIDGIVNQMEDASIAFVDLLVKYEIDKKSA